MNFIFILLFTLATIFTCGNGAPGKVEQKQSRFLFRLERSLPSVSDDHFQELASDGSYRYAYTGKDSYHAERRLTDGTVEGETLYIRPDGIPVKVHYFADAKSGYRPSTEVLYAERIRSTVVVPTPRAHVADLIDARPSVFLAPPSDHIALPVRFATGDEGSQVNAVVEGNKISLGNALRSGENVAISSPSVTAIIGPGGRAELRPQSFASTRSGGGIAISNPSSTAIIGPGGSAILSPSSEAFTNGNSPETAAFIIPSPQPTFPARGIWTPVDHPPPVAPQPFPLVARSPTNPSVVLVPSNPSYEYTYTYSAPDSKHPYRDNSAFVNVRVNQ